MNNKVVIITGASSGIGEACASVFAAQHFAVVLAARNAQKLSAIAHRLQNMGGKILPITCDVSKEADCQQLISATLNTYGRIDVLINNAGLSMRALFEELDIKVMHQLMDTNFWGAVYCTKFALPSILENKGSIVGISSIAGKKGLPGRTGYSASKFAMEGFLETLRIENLQKGLHVLVACPGFTATAIRNTALSASGAVQGESPRDESKMMQPEEVALAIYRAVVKRKRDLILTTDGKLTVWLNKFFPGMMDKIIYKHMAKEPGSPFK